MDPQKAAQDKRSKKYRIAPHAGGSISKPSEHAALDDSEFADPVNYKYPIDATHIHAALSYWGKASNRSEYSKAEQAVVQKRILRAAKDQGVAVDPATWEGADGNEGWIPVLRTGTFTGKNSATGDASTISVDRARLDRIVANYDVTLSETPLCIGHPKTDDPAFGWVEKFRRVGDVLEALPSKILPEFREAVRQGLYKYVSAKIRPNDTIAHIGFLGAAAPAVQGLGAVTLAEKDDGITVELSSDSWLEKSLFRRILSALQRISDGEVEENGVEAGDKIMTADDVAEFSRDIENLPDDIQTAESPATSLSEEELVDPKELQRLLAAANAQVTELTEKLTKATTELATATSSLAALQKQIKDEKTAAATTEFSEYCDAAVKQGRLKAGDKAATVALMLRLRDSGNIDLSEADGSTSKKSALEYLKNLIALKKPDVTFTEVATPDRVGQTTDLSEAESMSNAITTYINAQEKNGVHVSYPDALAHVKSTRQ